jgi:hypothetical protein
MRSTKSSSVLVDISKFLGWLEEKEGNNVTHEKEASKLQCSNNGKILIEIDSNVLENAVFNVLKSEKGQEIIRSVPRRRNKLKASGDISG